MLYIYLFLIALSAVLFTCFILNVIYINYERLNAYIALEDVNIIN